MSQRSNRVLVVEDNPVNRSFLEIALAMQGYEVVSAADVPQAQSKLEGPEIENFSCVVTDYRMPEHSGLELLAWIQEKDSSLATILVTAEGEKSLVTESLRGGAVDFLDKPVSPKKLYSAVERAVRLTGSRRHMARSESAAKELGLTQQRMLAVDASEGAGRVEILFHPKHEAGGDYFSRFWLGPEKLFCLMTDVSGHDLHAAYISAYFQGLIRGLLARKATIREIFPCFNQFLLEEWNHSAGIKKSLGGCAASVAACAMVVDHIAQTVTVITQGTPAPVYCKPDGEARMLGTRGGFPLGWFPDLTSECVICSIVRGGTMFVWTDGLEDLAEKQGVSALSLVHALHMAKENEHKPKWIDDASDDILVACVHVGTPGPASEPFLPLLFEEYKGSQSGEIDDVQAYWQRSLTVAVPSLPEGRLYDILLASREALLNALNHGCCGDAGKTAVLQMAWCPQKKGIRVRVSDPGAGHRFDSAGYDRLGATELVERHRGLILMRHLADDLKFERNGASVIMDFVWT